MLRVSNIIVIISQCIFLKSLMSVLTFLELAQMCASFSRKKNQLKYGQAPELETVQELM